MKALIAVFFLFALVSPVLADEIEINPLQEEYNKGTTFQTEIIINSFLYEDISSNKINLFFNDTKIDVVPLLKKINDNKYFLYFKLPNNLADGNYNLILKDLVYDSNGVLVVSDVSEEIIVTDIMNNTFYVEPSFIFVENLESQYSTDIELLSSGGLNEVQLVANNQYCYISPSKITLLPGDAKDFNVRIDSLINKNNENYLTVSNGKLSYKIPIYFNSIVEVVNNSSENEIDIKFNIGLNKYRDVFIINDKLENKEIKIKNFGAAGVEDINFNLEGNISKVVTLKNDKISFLDSNGEATTEIDINALEIGEYIGSIVLTNNNVVLDRFQMEIIVVQNSDEKELILNQSVNNNEPEPENNKDSSVSYFIIGFFTVILILGIIYFIYRRKTNLPS